MPRGSRSRTSASPVVSRRYVATASARGRGHRRRRRPTIFVANDAMPNFLFGNDADGTFTDIAGAAGVAVTADGKAKAGMGTAFADFGGNGRLGLIVTNHEAEMHSVFLNVDGAIFSDVTVRSGVGPATRPDVGFGVAFFDYDNDTHRHCHRQRPRHVECRRFAAGGSDHAFGADPGVANRPVGRPCPARRLFCRAPGLLQNAWRRLRRRGPQWWRSWTRWRRPWRDGTTRSWRPNNNCDRGWRERIRRRRCRSIPGSHRCIWSEAASTLRFASSTRMSGSAIRAAIAELPDAGAFRWQVATLAARRGRTNPANLALISALNRYVVLVGRGELHIRLARLAQTHLEYESAIGLLERATALIPNNPVAHKTLARAYIEDGRDSEGYAELIVALMLAPDDADTLTGIGRLHLAEGRLPESIEALQRAVAIDRTKQEALQALGDALVRAGKTAEGQTRLQEIGAASCPLNRRGTSHANDRHPHGAGRRPQRCARFCRSSRISGTRSSSRDPEALRVTCGSRRRAWLRDASRKQATPTRRRFHWAREVDVHRRLAEVSARHAGP